MNNQQLNDTLFRLALYQGGFLVFVSQMDRSILDDTSSATAAFVETNPIPSSVPQTTTLGWLHKKTRDAFDLHYPAVFFMRFLDPAETNCFDLANSLIDEVLDPETVVPIPREAKFVVEGNVFFDKMAALSEFSRGGPISFTEGGVVVTIRKNFSSPTKTQTKLPGSYPG